MGVKTTHTLYQKYQPSVKLVRDAIEGTPAIVANAKIYTPFLSALDDKANEVRIKRASFDNYTARTLDGFTGLIFSKNPKYEVPAQIENLLWNIDLNNKSHIDLMQLAASETLATGRCGLLVDMQTSNINEPIPRFMQQDSRPYVTFYPTESIINWKIENNKLVMVNLMESKQIWTSQFESEYKMVNRVLYLNENGKYTIDIYIDEEKQGDSINPIQNGQMMDYIPFIPITADTLTIEPKKPPLFDLADSNISMHRLKIDLYHALFFTIPTAYGHGIQPNEADDIILGSTVMHTFSRPEAELKYLEFQGQGLQHYFNEIEKCKESMGALGAEFLRNSTAKVEATETVAIRNSADRATLISVADTISRGMVIALEYMAKWLGVDANNIVYELNKDYNLNKMDAQYLAQLTTSYLSGVLSKKDLYDALIKGEVISDTLEFEEWADTLETAPMV